MNRIDTPFAHLAGGVHHCHRRAGRELAAPHPADADDAHIGRIVQCAHLHLEWAVRVGVGRRHTLHDGIKQRRHVVAQALGIEAGHALGGGREHGGEVQLRFAGAELVEQVEHRVHHPMRLGGVTVDLVHHQDGVQPGGERLGGDEAGLRHRPFHRIHQQQHGVHHGQHPLHLAAEVRVAGRIHDVDAAPRMVHRRRLGQNGDAALALQLVAVEGALDDLGARVGRGLLQQAIHEGGLAVIDMGDDGDVADVHLSRCGP